MSTNNSTSQQVKTGFLIAFTVWWFFWGTLHAVILQNFGVDVKVSFIDALVSIGLLAAFCLLIVNNMGYYLPAKGRYLYVLIVSLVLSTCWLLADRYLLKTIYKTDTNYLQFLSKTIELRYAFSFLMLACMTMLSLMWYARKEQEENSRRKQDTERLAREAELNKLRQQLQPHFLFNSLNSISALTGSQPEKARHMIQQLSDFLRGTLKKDEQQFTNFEEELQYLQLYLDIEKVRFGYRLNAAISYEPEVLAMRLPALLLQPVVENAIKFGLYDTIGDVTIYISAEKKDGILQISVANPYDETTAIPVKGTGFGLSSINRRLFLLFGRQDLLQINKEAGQFKIIISIPQLT